MDITPQLLQQLSVYICPLHGDDTYFKIEPLEGVVSVYCCDLCEQQIEELISAGARV